MSLIRRIIGRVALVAWALPAFLFYHLAWWHDILASGYGDFRVDYWEIQEQIWDDDDPEDMTIVDSTVLGYRKC